MTRIYKLISLLLHPILLPIIASILFFIVNDTAIANNLKYMILVLITISTYLIPLVLLVLLKKLKRIESYELKNIQERKIPLLMMIGIFFLLGSALGSIDEMHYISILFLGNSLALALCYFVFLIHIKSSIHLIGAGSLLGFVLIYSHLTQTNLLLLIAVICILTGLIAHARLYLKAHTLKEIVLGFCIGFIAQILAFSTLY